MDNKDQHQTDDDLPVWLCKKCYDCKHYRNIDHIRKGRRYCKKLDMILYPNMLACRCYEDQVKTKDHQGD